jgi:hypothetical protein
MALHFRCVSAHIGIFDLPRTIVSGNNGQTGASLDVRARLAGSANENEGLMSGMSARLTSSLSLGIPVIETLHCEYLNGIKYYAIFSGHIGAGYREMKQIGVHQWDLRILSW